MKPPKFEYAAAGSVEEAVELLHARGEEAKILAGGQSLVPLMNLRLTKPEFLIDINRIKALDYIKDAGGGFHVGALTRHRMIEISPIVQKKCPILNEGAKQVGHLAIRNRGTFGGSLAHADPAAEFPMLCVALDARIKLRSRQGERTVNARDFFVTYLTTAMKPDELLTEIEVPARPARTGWGFHELCRRPGDFAIAAVAALLTVDEKGNCTEARIAMGGVGPTPIRASEAEATLKGQTLSEQVFQEAGQKAAKAADPGSDVHASAEFRRHIVDVLTKRALRDALNRAKEV